MATRHRSDIGYDDLKLLARFVRALDKVFINSMSPVFELGEYDMLLPLWGLTGNGWEVSSYRLFTQEAIGLSRNGMLQVCRDYMRVPVAEVLAVLYKLSMLAVIPGTEVMDKPQFRQPFFGVPRDFADWPEANSMTKYVKSGFVIEKRRAVGGFR